MLRQTFPQKIYLFSFSWWLKVHLFTPWDVILLGLSKTTSIMNILITGAFGFVGSNLSKALSTAFKHHLIAVDVSEPEHHNYSEYIPWDKLHTPGKKKIDAIIHLAGKAHDTRNTAE